MTKNYPQKDIFSILNSGDIRGTVVVTSDSGGEVIKVTLLVVGGRMIFGQGNGSTPLKF